MSDVCHDRATLLSVFQMRPNRHTVTHSTLVLMVTLFNIQMRVLTICHCAQSRHRICRKTTCLRQSPSLVRLSLSYTRQEHLYMSPLQSSRSYVCVKLAYHFENHFISICIQGKNFLVFYLVLINIFLIFELT